MYELFLNRSIIGLKQTKFSNFIFYFERTTYFVKTFVFYWAHDFFDQPFEKKTVSF